MTGTGRSGHGSAAAVTAGLVVGVVEVVLALSFAALVFAGPLPGHVAAASGLSLAGAAVMLAVVGLGASRAGSAGSVQDVPAALLAAGATAIAARTATTDAAFATTVALMAVAALACGITFVLAGWLRLGRLIRFLPYSVVGGFLAGTGLVLVRGGLEVASPPSDGWLAGLGEPATMGSWALALAVALTVLGLLRRRPSVWVLPAVVGTAVATFHVVRRAGGHGLADLAAGGWVLDVDLAGSLWQPFGGATWGAVDLPTLVDQAPMLLALVALTGVALLLQVSGIEVSVRQDLDLDRELRVAGAANLGVAMVGGLPGYHALAFTALNERTGVRRRWGTLVAAGVCLVVMAGGGSVVALAPTFVLGGVLVLIGLDFLLDWVVAVRHRVTRLEHASIVGIATVVAVWGFLPAIVAGLVAAVLLFVVTYSSIEAVRSQATLAELHSTVDRPQADHLVRRTEGRAVVVLQLQGYLFFGTAARVVDRVQQAAREEPLRAVVLDMARVTGTDSSAVQSFVRLRQFLAAQGAPLLVAGWDERQVAAIVDDDPEDGDRGVVAFPDLDRALEHAEEVLLARTAPARAPTPTADEWLRSLFGDGELSRRLSQLAQRRTLAPGEVLVTRDGPATGAIDVVVTGWLDVGDDGRRVRRLGPGSVLGEVSWLTGGPPSATVVAATPVELWRLDPHALDALEAREPLLARDLERALGRIAAERLVDVLQTLGAIQR